MLQRKDLSGKCGEDPIYVCIMKLLTGLVALLFFLPMQSLAQPRQEDIYREELERFTKGR
jgi:ArsR family metal-binding transcriptional regulator